MQIELRNVSFRPTIHRTSQLKPGKQKGMIFRNQQAINTVWREGQTIFEKAHRRSVYSRSLQGHGALEVLLELRLFISGHYR